MGPFKSSALKAFWKVKIDELRLTQLQETHPNSCQDNVKKLDSRTYGKILDALLPVSKLSSVIAAHRSSSMSLISPCSIDVTVVSGIVRDDPVINPQLLRAHRCGNRRNERRKEAVDGSAGD